MDAVNFIKTYQRMCGAFQGSNCENKNGEYCPLRSFTCSLEEVPAEEIETIAHKVENWGKVHPVRTKASDLKKVFPFVKCYDDGTPRVCPKPFMNGYCPHPTEGCNPEKCHKEFWNTEIQED